MRFNERRFPSSLDQSQKLTMFAIAVLLLSLPPDFLRFCQRFPITLNGEEM